MIPGPNGLLTLLLWIPEMLSVCNINLQTMQKKKKNIEQRTSLITSVEQRCCIQAYFLNVTVSILIYLFPRDSKWQGVLHFPSEGAPYEC